MVDNGTISLSAGVNYSYLRDFEQFMVWSMLFNGGMAISTEDTEELKNASRNHELTEAEIKEHFNERPAGGKEKTPKKQSVKFAFDEISDFFPDMKPKEVKNKIMEILFAWYDKEMVNEQAVTEVSIID